MRVYLVETDGAGGMIHYAFQMAVALQREGSEVTLVTGRHYELDGVEAPFRVEPRLRLWPAIERRKRPLPRPVRLIRRAWRGLRFAWEWRRLGSHLLRERPDVVQFSTLRFPFQALMLRRLKRRGLRLSQVCHEFEPRDSRFPLLARAALRLASSAYRSFDIMFFHGEEHRRRFEDLYETGAAKALIPHGDESLLASLADGGGDLRGEWGIGDTQPVVLFFGGLRPSKGLPDLVDAFADVADQVPDAVLAIAGNPVHGFDSAGLQDRADHLGIGGRFVQETGYVPLERVGPLIRTATVVVLPYRSGTASGVIQAAYAFDRPVVCTDVGSLPEAVVNGQTGLVVPPHDPPALAAAIVKILSDPTEAAAMGSAGGHLAATKFGWGSIAATVTSEYRKLL